MNDETQKRKVFKIMLKGYENTVSVHVCYMSSDKMFGTFSKEVPQARLGPSEFVVDTDKWWWKNLKSVHHFKETEKEVKVGMKKYPVWTLLCENSLEE